MKRLPNIQKQLSAIAVVLAALLCGCSANSNPDSPTANQGEHDREGGEHDRSANERHGEEGEESGKELSLDQNYDDVRNGARLILAYDAQSNSFHGTVENTTKETLERVRVEVHLSNGKELGPTTPADLGPGETKEVKLIATSKDFDGWTAHPEVGSSEHGHGGKDGREGRGEHDRDDGERREEGGSEHQ